MPAWICLILSGVGLFLSSWIVVPAPTFTLLPLSVGAPEISPLLLLGNALVLLLSLWPRSHGWLRLVAIGCSVVGLVLSSLPLFQLPATLQQADRSMETALGRNYLTQISTPLNVTLRQHPFAVSTLMSGLPVPAVQPDRQFFPIRSGQLPLDIYRSGTTGRQPAIVTIYGGAWQWGDPTQTITFNRWLAAHGYTVIAIDYRHAPDYRFPTQLQDVQAALQWVAQHADTYQIDRDRVALMGWSAGAHLALLSAYQATPHPQPLTIRAVVSYYGPTNLTAGYQDPPRPDPIHTRAVLNAFLGGSPDQLPHAYTIASPIHFVRSGLPPTLLIYGGQDHIVKPIFGHQLYEGLRSTNNRAVWVALPWSEHAFDAVFRGLGNQVALYYTERFLAWTLR